MPTGRVRYEPGYKMAGTPLAKLGFSSSSQPSRLSSTFIGDFEFPPWKGREGDWIGGDLHQDRRLRDLDFQSHLHSLSQGTLIPDLIRSKRLGHDFEIPLVEMLHYLSRSNAQSLDWIGDKIEREPLVRVAVYIYRTCPVWASSADSSATSTQYSLIFVPIYMIVCLN